MTRSGPNKKIIKKLFNKGGQTLNDFSVLLIAIHVRAQYIAYMNMNRAY